MKLPRDISGQEFIQKLKKYGYIQTRQTGSHARLTTLQNGEHHITIPPHEYLKLGTLSSVLSAVAMHFDISKETLIKELFE